jgi:hypothetical protein
MPLPLCSVGPAVKAKMGEMTEFGVETTPLELPCRGAR